MINIYEIKYGRQGGAPFKLRSYSLYVRKRIEILKLEKYQLVGKGYFAKKIQKDPHPGSGVKKAGNLIPTN